MENREPFAENTKLCTATLIDPQGTEDCSEVCTLPGGDEVNFYQVIPLYADELDYKLEHDADALLNIVEPLIATYLGALPSVNRKETFRDNHIDMRQGDYKMCIRDRSYIVL